MRFGTSGVRGLVLDMTDEVCAAHVGAFLAHMARQGETAAGEALMARDLRPSSPRIAAACLDAVRAAGLDAADCGVAPTPALALEASVRGAPAIMVTGSHIPADRNGLKFYRPGAEITKADEAGILSALAEPAPPAARRGRAIDTSALTHARWMARARALAGPESLRGLRVGVWLHSAAGGDWLVEALSALGAQTVALGRSASFTALDTEAIGQAEQETLRDWAQQHSLDAIVSTDGDGDRPLVTDGEGKILRGDALGLLTARWLGADAVAAPLNASSALERSGWIGRVARTRIGSPYVIEAMGRLSVEGARTVVGYEANGGFLLGSAVTGFGGAQLAALPTRDALTPIIAVLAQAATGAGGLPRLIATLPHRATASARIERCNPACAAALLAALATDGNLRAAAANAAGGGHPMGLDLTDGVRIMLQDGEFLHLRASGNAPELRCYTEAAEPDRAAALATAALAWAVVRLAP